MTALVLVAAGSGQRLGAGRPKALVEVGGRSLIEHSLATARQVGRITALVVVAPAGDVAELAASPGLEGVVVVSGGDTRDASVRAGLAALTDGHEFVLVHDAARPFVPVAVYDRVIDALSSADAVVPGLPVADTVKRVGADGVVTETLDRAELVAVQTPQGFRLQALVAAHRTRRGEVTDDAMLMEQSGVAVHVVEGSPRAFKITTAFDLSVARAMLQEA